MRAWIFSLGISTFRLGSVMNSPLSAGIPAGSFEKSNSSRRRARRTPINLLVSLNFHRRLAAFSDGYIFLPVRGAPSIFNAAWGISPTRYSFRWAIC
jgi:hypothetical protein